MDAIYYRMEVLLDCDIVINAVRALIVALAFMFAYNQTHETHHIKIINNSGISVQHMENTLK